MKIYTFGQPRVGNTAFTDAFKSKISEWYRLVHNKDLVPHIPPCISDLKHGCIVDGILPFYPHHAPEEIFYNEPMSSYKKCSTANGEDPTCSDADINTSTADHISYFGINIGNLHNQDMEEPELHLMGFNSTSY